jgi:hypothetical protein
LKENERLNTTKERAVCSGQVAKNHQSLFKGSLALLSHACNPSYSGGIDQEDRGLKPAQANSL